MIYVTEFRRGQLADDPVYVKVDMRRHGKPWEHETSIDRDLWDDASGPERLRLVIGALERTAEYFDYVEQLRARADAATATAFVVGLLAEAGEQAT